MKLYTHKAQYYETDQMGIVHHSNYIRWFEEARTDLLEQIGFGYQKMEEQGILIPVLGVSCEYKSMVRYHDTVMILPKIEKFTGVKLVVSYRVVDVDTGDLRAMGESRHCFLDGNYRPVSVQKKNPAIYDVFRLLTGVDPEQQTVTPEQQTVTPEQQTTAPEQQTIAPQPPQKNVVFDLGRVLLDFEPKKYLMEKFPTDKAEKLFHSVFSSRTWLELDRGALTDEEAVLILTGRHPELKEEISWIFETWPQILTPIERNIDLLYRLKDSGYPLYLLSNFHRDAFLKTEQRHDFFSRFDGRVISCDTMSIKPEEQIYQTLCRKYSLRPEESLFIDDTAANVEAAARLGFQTIHYQSPDQLRKDLSVLGISGL